MKPINHLSCNEISWRGRDAYLLENGLVRVVTLTGGGHVAEFRFEDSTGLPSMNPLWVPPWRTIEPYRYREKSHARYYGSITEGKLLSGLVGHNICLDFFGSPSLEEAREGISQHGEAPSARWHRKAVHFSRQRVALGLSVKLPASGLRLTREIELRQGESVAYFKETVRNERRVDHFFHWTQHVTLGLPFLAPRDSLVVVPGTKCLTFPHGYDEGKSLLAPKRVFRWPKAPLLSGGRIDLTRPFLRRGLGFVVAVLLNPRRNLAFVAAVNNRIRLLVAYCFKRADFPWVAVWEENLGIAAPPWRRRTRARGLEFSTTPFPVMRREAFTLGTLFGESTLAYVPARAEKTTRYIALLTQLPDDFGGVRDIQVGNDKVLVHVSGRKDPIGLRASGINGVSS